jgi:hypothetical protein
MNYVLLADVQCPTSPAYLRELIEAKVEVRAIVLINRKLPYSQTLKHYIRHPALVFRKLIVCRFENFFRRSLQLNPRPSSVIKQASTCRLPIYEVKVQSINDSEILAVLKQFCTSTFIYTDGGLVGEEVLENFTLLHAHPGLVPLIRGSDGLLWSLETLRVLTCSLIIMNLGIDTGRVLLRAYSDCPQLSGILRFAFSNLPTVAYELLTRTLDVEIRAKTLSHYLNVLNARATSPLEAFDQEVYDLPPYLTMHPQVRSRVLKSWATHHYTSNSMRNTAILSKFNPTRITLFR